MLISVKTASNKYDDVIQKSSKLSVPVFEELIQKHYKQFPKNSKV